MTKRLDPDEKLKRAMDREVRRSVSTPYKTAVCIAPVYTGVCGLDVYKDGRRPWKHVNATAQHRIVLDPATVRER